MNPGTTGSAPPMSKISGYKQRQVQQFTPQQLQLLESLIGNLMGGIGGASDYLSKLATGDEDVYQQLDQPALNAFKKYLGEAGNMYSHLGALDSNYFENAISGKGAELAQDLQAQRLGLRNSAINALLGQSNSLLSQRPFETVLQPKEKKAGTDWGALGQLGGSLLGGAGGFLFGGPSGAITGAQLGGGLGRAGGSAFTR